ncbi:MULTISPECIES: glycosyltransferase family 61 protein [Acinetobacter]|jgi:capsular polysaccharide biosynthesis protein|uniref:glycosyltransferase family 61 protein n=1 Tax=Acinetobacter TaxID=469 RepID=UPI001F60D9F3|nr:MULTISPECIES: glycosyltransferase family 61 protein [Acinetobacter]MEB5928169.1 glycosyltransferase family 61 protein [Acinetobacter schindleri]UNT59745.1 glycosyltransferase family 61 protein [Acinetobacter sp. ASP199]
MIRQILLNYAASKDFNLSGFFVTLLKLKKIYIKKIVWLDQLPNDNLQMLAGDERCVSYSPQLPEQQELFKFTEKSIQLYKFDHVLINITSSCILLRANNKMIVERVEEAPIEYSDYSAGFVKKHNSDTALVRLNQKRIKMNNVLYLGGNGCFNYYHWLIEIIPKLLYLNNDILAEYQIDSILCDISAQRIESFGKILNIILTEKGIDLPIKYVNRKNDIELQRILYVNNFNNLVFNSKIRLSGVEYSHFYINSLKKLRKILINAVNKKDLGYKKIFLARKESQVRFYNQAEVLSYFISQGFKPVYLEEYSFEEQISLFTHADFIVGPSGAAWSNIIFCKEGCQGMSWLPERLSEFSAFSSLAKIFGCDLKFILTDQSENKQDIHSNYVININKLIELYTQMTTVN